MRLAVPGDEPAIADYLRQATTMTTVDDPGFIPTACPGIVAALERGQQGFIWPGGSIGLSHTADQAPNADQEPDPDDRRITARRCATPTNSKVRSVNDEAWDAFRAIDRAGIEVDGRREPWLHARTGSRGAAAAALGRAVHPCGSR
jgi:hypothetical protein